MPLALACHGGPPNIFVLCRIRILIDIHIVLSNVVYLKDDVIDYVGGNGTSVEDDTWGTNLSSPEDGSGCGVIDRR